MVEAALWGAIAGTGLLLGGAIALIVPIPRRVIGLIMGFGAGALISALAFELANEALHHGGADALVVGLALGALMFFFADAYIDRMGAKHRKRSGDQMKGSSAPALVVGSLLDGIPEAAVVGISLLAEGEVGLAVVGAVFLSNVPEALSATTGMRTVGHSAKYILGIWLGVAAASVLASAGGFALLGEASGNLIGGIEAFAAGAVLTMLADTMMPEAFEEGGSAVGLVTVLGFAAALLLTHLA